MRKTKNTLNQKRPKPASKRMTIPLASPDITEEACALVMETLQSNTLCFGPKLEEFEQAIAAYSGRKYGIAVNSGTSALHLIIKSLDIADGDQVITTPFSFISSANCMLFERAEPLFVDINSDDLNFSPELIEIALKKDTNKRIKAILAVDVFAHPADWDALYGLAEKYNVKLIEDSCEALGSEYRSQDHLKEKRWEKLTRTGSFGNASVFAFYPNKLITTGEGGLVLTDDRQITDMCRSLRNQGRDPESDDWFAHKRLGYNYRISDINCALGLSQLNRVDEIIKKRQKIADYYSSKIKMLPFVEPPFCAPNVTLGWFVYVVRLTKNFTQKDRNSIMQKLMKKGVACSNYFAPIHLQPFYRKLFGYKPGDFPVTEDVSNRTIALPFFNTITHEQIDYVVDTLKSVFKAR